MLDFPEEHKDLLKELVPDYYLNLIQLDELPEEVIERLTGDSRYQESRKSINSSSSSFSCSPVNPGEAFTSRSSPLIFSGCLC